jgi:hypothetical protein
VECQAVGLLTVWPDSARFRTLGKKCTKLCKELIWHLHNVKIVHNFFKKYIYYST